MRIFADICLSIRPQSLCSESRTDGLHSYGWLAGLSRGLRTIDGLWWLMAASHGLQVQTGTK